MYSMPTFFKTGHRGCRGLFPENTVAGFVQAIQLGCNSLELDVVVSKDNLLVVSHEPYMHPEICLLPDGTPIPEEDQKKYNLYQMVYQEIKTYDCGIKFTPRFPQQKKLNAFKPLLLEVILACEKYILDHQLPPIVYDLELKSEAAEYGISQPMPDVFAELLATFIVQNHLDGKVIVRSFDPAPLQYLHRQHPSLPLALIVENNQSAEANLEALGFLPYIYSPEYVLLSKNEMSFLKSQSLLVIPWTVNTAEEIREMLRLEVDGIITDYPDLFKTMGL